MRGDFDALHVDPLVGQTIKYVHVTSVRQVAERLPATARVLQDVRTRGGTRELLVRGRQAHSGGADRARQKCGAAAINRGVAPPDHHSQPP
jgi:hypothetical protein